MAGHWPSLLFATDESAEPFTRNVTAPKRLLQELAIFSISSALAKAREI